MTVDAGRCFMVVLRVGLEPKDVLVARYCETPNENQIVFREDGRDLVITCPRCLTRIFQWCLSNPSATDLRDSQCTTATSG